MPDKKLPKPPVAESPIADVFEDRHPSPAEKDWAEKTLLPTLEKSPEKPIGARHGTNLDEQGNARFTTISGVPIRRLYTEADLPEDWNAEKYLAFPASRHSRAAFTPPDIAASFSPCGSSPASPRRRKPTSATSICSSMAAAGCRSHSICPR